MSGSERSRQQAGSIFRGQGRDGRRGCRIGALSCEREGPRRAQQVTGRRLRLNEGWCLQAVTGQLIWVLQGAGEEAQALAPPGPEWAYQLDMHPQV